MSRRLVTISVENEGSFTAAPGARLLDAGLMQGVDMPHDCGAGVCGTCKVRVLAGSTEGGETGEPGAVLACRARVTADLTIAIDEVPEVASVAGRVASVIPLARDVVEVTIAHRRRFTFLPGQYARFRFTGFPARSFSPTVPLSGIAAPGTLRLHVRRVAGGHVSGALGAAIGPGHPVRITGPFGSACLRPGTTRPLVLVASGTGFAPVWSIAHAALCEMPDRPVMMIAGARTLASLYFGQALLRLADFPRVQVAPVLAQGHRRVGFAVGSPADHLPALSPADCIYACGAPAMVQAVQDRARAAGAVCHADIFAPSAAKPP